MAGANGVDIIALHQFDVFEHPHVAHLAPSVGIVLVPIDAEQTYRFTDSFLAL